MVVVIEVIGLLFAILLAGGLGLALFLHIINVVNMVTIEVDESEIHNIFEVHG